MDPRDTTGRPSGSGHEHLDDRLRDAFRRNAPRDDETHLEAALRPGTWIEPDGARSRAPRRRPARPRLRLAVLVGGAVVLAAVVAVGSWQAVAHLGGKQSVVVFGNSPGSTAPANGGTSSTAGQATTPSTAAESVKEQLVDGVWEFRVDRRVIPQDFQVPSAAFTEDDYHRVDGKLTPFRVTLSNGGANVLVEGEWGNARFEQKGTRGSVTDEEVLYLLESNAGGRFVIWQGSGSLQAEYTEYGSGVPIIQSFRGRFLREVDTQAFLDAWKETAAAVNALGPTKVDIKQTFTALTIGADGQVSATPRETSIVTVEEWLDRPNKRARMVVTGPRQRDEHVIDGRDDLEIITEDTSASSKSPALRSVSVHPPSGLPGYLWAGGETSAFTEIEFTRMYMRGFPWDQRVDKGGDGLTSLTWRREWTEGEGADRVTVDLNQDLLPMTIKIVGQGTLDGARIEHTINIEYTFQMGMAFQDSDFPLDLPGYAQLEMWIQGSTADHPVSDPDWGQYWLGLSFGENDEWSLKTGRIDALPDVLKPNDESETMVYERIDPSSDFESYLTFKMTVQPRQADAAAAAKKLGDQQVEMGTWSRTETQVASRMATVYSKPLEGAADHRVGTLYLFLQDAFVTIDLGGLADAQQVLEAVTPLIGGMSSPDTTPTS
jgi:hypothetical protein